METKDIIMWAVLVFMFIKLIYLEVSVKYLEEQLYTVKGSLFKWFKDLCEELEYYMELPDNLRDFEKTRMERNQKKAKEWEKEWEKKNVK